MNYVRRTLANAATFEGLGLHTGEPSRLTVHPGEGGIWFRWGSERTQARPENVTDTARCTKLGSVSTIEHVMSALAGLEITDAELELHDAPELPGLDGSGIGFVEGLRDAGFSDFGEAEIPSLYSRVFRQDDDLKIAISKGTGHWRYEYVTTPRWPGEQSFEVLDVQREYVDQIASARTFALAEEIPMIIQLGLGRGLDEDSALILGIEGYKNKARFEDEPARHKLLDLIGDLYLSGVPVRFLNVVARRTGHTAHVNAAQLLVLALGS